MFYSLLSRRKISLAWRGLSVLFCLLLFVFLPRHEASAQTCNVQTKCTDPLYYCVAGNCQCRWGKLNLDWSSIIPGAPNTEGLTQGASVCTILRTFIGTSGNAASGLGVFINFLVVLATGAVVMAAAIVIVWGGYLYMTAGGNAEQVQRAKSWITAALLGIIIALTAYVILNTINSSTVP